MSKIQKTLTILVLSIGILFALPKNAFAASETQTYGAHKYYKGVGNITVYIDRASGAGYWENFIVNATNNWMYTGVGANPIYTTFVSSKTGSTMDIYANNNAYWIGQGKGSDVLAETLFFDTSNVKFNPGVSAKNWMWTEIHINDENFRKPTFSNENALGTIIHEMGHAWGLAHNNSNPNSIM